MKMTLLVVLATLSACAAFDTGTVREHTYPPDFEYLDKKPLKSKMWVLAKAVTEVNEVLRKDHIDAAGRAEVIAALERMVTVASELERPGQRTNHPVVDANLTAFQQDVVIALKAAQADPPNYFLVGSVAGSCAYCHAKASY